MHLAREEEFNKGVAIPMSTKHEGHVPSQVVLAAPSL